MRQQSDYFKTTTKNNYNIQQQTTSTKLDTPDLQRTHAKRGGCSICMQVPYSPLESGEKDIFRTNYKKTAERDLADSIDSNNTHTQKYDYKKDTKCQES